MKVNGFLLREAIRRWELRRDAAAGLFTGSLFRFSDEIKAAPDEIATKFSDAEDAVARLQTAQARYNLLVDVDVLGRNMQLAEAVKRLGGAGRLEKMWRDAASPKSDRYGYNDPRERESGKERAQAVLSQDSLMAKANKAAAWSSALRAAIASGNGRDIPCDGIGLDPELLTK